MIRELPPGAISNRMLRAQRGLITGSAAEGTPMDEELAERRVNCRRCRYRFPVEVRSKDDWQVEAQCPSCECWACFTVADIHDSPPGPVEFDAEAQRLGELLWRPINEHRGHRAVAWMDRVGNGGFEDDHTPKPWPIPIFWVYRFTRGQEAAYSWQESDRWFVRDWHPLRSHREPPAPGEVLSFEAALDRLLE
jgi:hypothetical protein